MWWIIIHQLIINQGCLLEKKNQSYYFLDQTWVNCIPQTSCRSWCFLNCLLNFVRKITFIKIFFVSFGSHLFTHIHTFSVSKMNNHYMLNWPLLIFNAFSLWVNQPFLVSKVNAYVYGLLLWKLLCYLQKINFKFFSSAAGLMSHVFLKRPTSWKGPFLEKVAHTCSWHYGFWCKRIFLRYNIPLTPLDFFPIHKN